MPELPEVETSRRGITPHIIGQTITDVVIRDHRLRWPIPKQLAARATSQRIERINRRGKYLLLETGAGCIIIHLGMSGSLRICASDTPPEKHDHVDFVFGNGKVLRLRDPRRFGAVLWTSHDPYAHKLLQPLGPEPLSADFSAGYLYQQTRKRSASIKSVIMNSHIVVGVGNIYACEALFIAGINPKRKAGSISLARCEKLVDAIRRILTPIPSSRAEPRCGISCAKTGSPVISNSICTYTAEAINRVWPVMQISASFHSNSVRRTTAPGASDNQAFPC